MKTSNELRERVTQLANEERQIIARINENSATMSAEEIKTLDKARIRVRDKRRATSQALCLTQGLNRKQSALDTLAVLLKEIDTK